MDVQDVKIGGSKMNVNTGEIMFIGEDQSIPDGVIKLTREEFEKLKDKSPDEVQELIDGRKSSITLAQDDELRQNITNRYYDGMNRKQRRSELKKSRKSGKRR